MHPIITLFVPFTRRWAVDQWLENLAAVEHDPALVNFCLIVDSDEPYVMNSCRKFATERNYRSFHVKMNTEWQPNEVRLAIRRQRVADVKNQSKDLIIKTDGEIIICFEDDTVFERLKSFQPLYQPLLDDPTIGFVEGVQMGRWGANNIGAWDADDFEFPQRVCTKLPPPEGFSGTEDITGGGFYGYATRREQYLDHEYYSATSEPWGPDVNYGFYLHRKGFKCLIDWGIVFGHNDHNRVGWPDALTGRERLVEVVYNKNSLTGKWERTDSERTRY